MSSRNTHVLTYIILTLLLQINVEGVNIPRSPCQSVFSYKRNESTGSVYGYLKFKNDLNGDYQLEIRMSIAKRTGDNVSVLRLPSEEDIQCGSDIEYKISFPASFGSLIPVITYVEFNDKIYCTGPAEKDIKGRGVTLLTEYDGLVTTIHEDLCRGLNGTTEKIIRNEDVGSKPPDDCGILDEVYIGPTGREHFPWLATINYPNTNNNGYLCSGTLISNSHIVTIANCVKNLDRINVTIRLGRNNKNEAAPSKLTTLRKVKSITTHPQFVANAYNIAIIELNQPVEYSALIRPICLWTGGDKIADVVNKQSVVIGWEGDSTPKKIVMPIVSENDCLQSNDLFYLVLDATSFCAGNRVDCIVNSIGGGLMLKRDDGRYYLRGMTAGVFVDKHRKCDSASYSMFTDVAKFVHWISSVVKK